VFHLLLSLPELGSRPPEYTRNAINATLALTSNGRLPYKPRDFRRGHSLVLGVRASTVSLRRRVILGKQRPAESKREADLPTEQAGAQAPPRFSRPHGDQGRPQDRGQAARARTQTAQCLIGDRDAAGIGTVEGLRLRAQFLAAAAGAKVPTRGFVLQARNRGDDGPVRVGFTVSKKVGTAVERNRVRRRLKEMVRLRGATVLPAGHDYVLVGRRAALSMAFDQITEDFERALRRLRVSA
jgi:ribonuclease P protein component